MSKANSTLHTGRVLGQVLLQKVQKTLAGVSPRGVLTKDLLVLVVFPAIFI